MSAICGLVSNLLNEILGRPLTSTQAFAIGAATGLCMMGAYIGMTVIQVLSMLGTVLQMHFTAESAAELVVTLAYGVTGNDPNLLRDTVWATLVLIVNVISLGICTKFVLFGPRGSLSVSSETCSGNISSKASFSVNNGFDTTRINIANGPTRFSPSKKAGLKHVTERHFSPGKNAGQFTISIDELKSILGRKDIINTLGIPSATSGQYTRVVDVGEVVGTIKPSIPGVGGQQTTWITIITDVKGNLITTYPCPTP